jgi:hypothetical protein
MTAETLFFVNAFISFGCGFAAGFLFHMLLTTREND